MRRPALAALALLAVVLGVLTACSAEPTPDYTPNGTAFEGAATRSPTTARQTPEQAYLTRINASLSSTLTDGQMLQIGQAVCAFMPMMNREELVQSITAESTQGNREAAAVIVETARQNLCPSASYRATPAAPAVPAGPLDSFTAGTWEVGVDVVAGKYKTPGAADCYWARLQANDGSSGDIIDNGLGAGPQTVTIREGEYFETQRCGTWTLQP